MNDDYDPFEGRIKTFEEAVWCSLFLVVLLFICPLLVYALFGGSL